MESNYTRAYLYRIGSAPATVSTPTLTSKNVDTGVQVTLSCATGDAAIYYTTDGSAPSTSSTRYTAPFTLSASAKIRAIAVKSGSQNSAELSKQVTVNRTETPQISAEMSAEGFNITLSAESGAVVYYTMDGSDPTTASIRYSGRFTVAQAEVTICAIAVKEGKSISPVVSTTISANVPAAPVVTLEETSSNVIGIDGSISVNWDPVDYAFEYLYTVTADGEEVFSGTTQNTMASYTPTAAGVYQITVKAVNFTGQSEASAPPVTVTVKPDVTVRFVDHDGALVSEQIIHYGGDAIVPAAPSRVGHTFTKWSGSYTGVKADTTVTATYVADTHTIKFLDSSGNVLSSELVEYGQSVTSVPTAPERTGYVFTAWSVKSGDGDSYTCVNGDTVFEPTYTWAEPDMPVALSVTHATRNTDASGYSVTVQAVNSTDQTVSGKLITVIKTSTDKVVATKIDLISIPAGAENYVQTVSLGGTAVGTVAEAYVVANDTENDNRTGGAYSSRASCQVTQESSTTSTYWGDWSEWSETPVTADEITEVETKVQYRYSDMETTTSTSSSLEGWTQNGSSVTYGSWGSWSAWTTTKHTSSATKGVETRTAYKYQHYCNDKGDIAPTTAYSNAKYGPHALYFTSKQKVSRTSSTGYTITDGLEKCEKYATSYYYMGTVTQYRYRTRTATTYYNYYRWTDYSDWEDTVCTESSTRQVETRTVYRYRNLITQTTTEDTPYLGAEDISGTSYAISGSLTNVAADYSGKIAIVMVYKDRNIDPTEDQMEYIGQITLGEGNSYDFTFVPREEISEDTGNYVISFGIATADGLVNNVQIIEAPKPVYNVVFLDPEGNIVSNQSVTQGEDAEAPVLEELQGYEITWDRSFTNVTRDMEIRAVATPKSYSVIFVDWANDRIVSIEEFEYGETISFPADCSAEGKVFTGWSVPENSIITGTTVVEALYEDVMFTATFLNRDGTVFTTQQVPYGTAVALPETDPTAEGYSFVTWSNESVWWNVTDNITIEPVFIFAETVEAPVRTLESDGPVNVDSGTVELESSTDEADIYYTIDGSDPTEEDLVFEDLIFVEETVTVRARAFKSGMNPSDVVEFTIEVIPSSDLPAVTILTNHAQYAIELTDAHLPVRYDNPEGRTIVGYGITIETAEGVVVKDYWNELETPVTDTVLGKLFSGFVLTQDTEYVCAAYVEFEDIGLFASETVTFTTGCDHEHTYTDTVTQPTCSDDGYTTHTCSVCGKSCIDTYVPTIAHTYEGGVCTVCGESEPERFDISFASMTMGNSLAINFAFEQGHVSDWTGHYAQITKVYADGRADVVETVPYANWKSTTIGGVAHYYVTFSNISAKEMTDNVYVTIYNAEGTAVSNTWTDSVRAQAMRNLAKSTITDLEKTMVVDMLNYGAAAQEYFSYNTADLATSELSDEQKAYATASTTYEDTHTGDENYFASNLVLKSNIQLMFAFRNVTTDMHAVITFTNHWGTAKTVTVEGSDFTANGSYYIVTVENMVVADARQDITCTVYDGETVVATATDSVESYTARKSDTLFDLLMRFSDSAYNYFHN